MRMIIYILGSLILLGAICYGATMIGVPPVWVGIGGAIILGLGIMGAARTGGPRGSGSGGGTVINKIE
jgi:hypothetical protein